MVHECVKKCLDLARFRCVMNMVDDALKHPWVVLSNSKIKSGGYSRYDSNGKVSLDLIIPLYFDNDCRVSISVEFPTDNPPLLFQQF